jgi:hypothetical protein
MEGFWVWMLIDCIMNEPNKYIWIWVLLVANILGAVIYFFYRDPLGIGIHASKLFVRLTRAGEIRQAESNVSNVPNAYNYSQLGNLYLETGNIKKAGDAFAKSLDYDPDDISSLWGAAQVDTKNKDFEKAKAGLEKIMKADPNYKFGEAGLAYSRALFETNDINTKKQLLKFTEKHSYPEAKLMLAKITADEGDKAGAVRIMEEALKDMKGSPAFYYRKHRKWIGKIKSLLRKTRHNKN